MLKEGDRVKMISYKGVPYSLTPMNPESLCELLIGSTGTVVRDPAEPSVYASFSEENQVLVRFDDNLEKLGMLDQTAVPNALWIRESDLRIL